MPGHADFTPNASEEASLAIVCGRQMSEVRTVE